MNSKAITYDATKFRILMLHGYGSNRSDFRAKSSQISRRISELVTPEILDDFPGGIEFLYPNAPITLEPPMGYGAETTEENEKQDDSEPTAMGWWYGRDTVNRYKGIENSLSFVARYIRGRPIHGIMGFSQGACLSGMICSLLECRNQPEKVAATRAQRLPVDDYLNLPGQEPLRFFIGIGGYRGTMEFYGSLYSSPIKTPSCHALGSMDAIVESFQTMNLAHCFASYELVHFYGCHFVPRDRASVESLARFAQRCSREVTPYSPHSLHAAGTWSQSDSDETLSTTWGSDQSLRRRERRRHKVGTRGRGIRFQISYGGISAFAN